MSSRSTRWPYLFRSTTLGREEAGFERTSWKSSEPLELAGVNEIGALLLAVVMLLGVRDSGAAT